MMLTDYLGGCLDAGDYAGAAACVLSHPASTRLSETSVSRLFDIAFLEKPTSRCDRLVIEIAGDIIRAMEARP